MKDRKCPIDCMTADTDKDKCECSCNGKNHGRQSTFKSYSHTKKEPSEINEDEEVLECRICGTRANYTDEFICAVDKGTPLADKLNLDPDQLHDNGFYPVCDNCYERGCSEF